MLTNYIRDHMATDEIKQMVRSSQVIKEKTSLNTLNNISNFNSNMNNMSIDLGRP